MPNLQLFINTTNNQLVAGLTSGQVVDPMSLPLFYPDTPNLAVYLLNLPPGYNPSNQSASVLATVSPAGLKLYAFLDSGLPGATPYTQQVSFTIDPTNSFFTGQLPLNTAGVQALIAGLTQVTAWLHIGYTDGFGNQFTVLSRQVLIRVGINPSAAIVVPPGLTPLSKQEALQLFWTVQPVAGRPLYIESPNGKTFALTAVDNPDGTASFGAPQLN